MSIKHITIHNVANLKTIINTPILITGNSNLQKEETSTNMWALSIDPSATKIITINDLVDFISSLLKKRTQQIKNENNAHSAIFYMWFDEMAAQLRFNIISDFHEKLPFSCTLNIIHSPEPILKDFLTSHYHAGIPWNEIKESESLDDNYDDEKQFILTVFVERLDTKNT